MARRGIAPHDSRELDESEDVAFSATAVIDEQGIVTGWSDGARRLLGYSREEVVGRPGATLLASDNGSEVAGPSAGDRSWSGHVVLRHRDGHDLRVGLLARRRRTAAGADWLVVRVTESRMRLRDEDLLMKWGFSDFPCVLALFDTDLLLVRANGDAERSVGLTEDQMRGLRVSELVAEQSEPGKVEEAMCRSMATGERERLRILLREPGDEREHAWSVWIAPSRDEDGRLRGFCFTAQDVTEQYTAQQRLLLLNKAGTRIGTTLDIRHTAQQLADVAVPQLADITSIDLLTFLEHGDEPPLDALTDNVALRRSAQRSVLIGHPEDPVELGDVTTYPQFSSLVERLEGSRTTTREESDRLLAQWAAHDPVRAGRLRSQGIHSVMAVPMRSRGVTLGMTMFMRHKRQEPFERDDMLLAEELTARTAVSIDNARRYVRERRTAETLQRDLLPQELPDQSALETVSRYLPARGHAGVGGDWFDVFPLSSARVALVVGDVVGHGLQASAAMGRFRTAVRALAEMGLPPDELLTHLDDMVTSLSEEAGTSGAANTGATCLYAEYDPVSRRCTVARAGHPMPAVLSPTGAVDILDVPSGPPLGVGGMPFEASETVLPEGSVLALYTNGLIAPRDRDLDEGLALLRSVLARPSPSLDAMGDDILDTLLPEHQQDDAALLLARTRALNADQVATWDLPADPAAVARIRSEASKRLSVWGLEDVAFTTELVVSELVTNAIRYGHPPIRLRLIHDRELICEVTDAGMAAPHLRPARLMDEGGRGLLLVAQLSRRWGVRYGRDGKAIWAEQSLPSDYQFDETGKLRTAF